MVIHNKLEIKKGNDVFVSFNTLLKPALVKIGELLSYSDLIAVGNGGSEGDLTQEKLESWQATFPLVTDSYNFDPLNGTLFLTKKLVLDETNQTPLEIVEVGLTGESGKNPRVANRFVVNGGEPIYRDAGEEMSLTITIYLEASTDSNLVLTGGSNPLVQLLLGGGVDKTLGGFKASKSDNLTLNSEIISRDVSGLELFDVEIESGLDETSGVLNLTIHSSLGVGIVKEFLLILNNVVVARSNVSEMSGVVDGLEKDYVADNDNMLTMDVSGVKEITSVVDVESGEELTNYTTRVFGTELNGELMPIFEDMGFNSDTIRVISKQGDKVAFVVGKAFHLYDFSSGVPVKLNTDQVDASNVYMFLIYAEILLLKVLSPDGTYSIRYYYFDPVSNKYLEKYYSVMMHGYTDMNGDGRWNSMDMVECGPNKWTGQRVLLVDSDSWLCGFICKIIPSNYTITRTDVFYTNVYAPNKAYAMLSSNRMQYQVYFYDPIYDKFVFGTDGQWTRVDSSFAKEIVNNFCDDGYPKSAKNYVYAVDNQTSTLKYFSLEDLTSGEMSFGLTDKIVVDQHLNYLVTYLGKHIDIYYLDGSLKQYKFYNGIDVDDDIEDVMIVASSILVIFKNGNIKYVNIYENKQVVVGAERGKQYKVVYSADKTPGASGGKVKAMAVLKVSI